MAIMIFIRIKMYKSKTTKEIIIKFRVLQLKKMTLLKKPSLLGSLIDILHCLTHMLRKKNQRNKRERNKEKSMIRSLLSKEISIIIITMVKMKMKTKTMNIMESRIQIIPTQKRIMTLMITSMVVKVMDKAMDNNIVRTRTTEEMTIVTVISRMMTITNKVTMKILIIKIITIKAQIITNNLQTTMITRTIQITMEIARHRISIKTIMIMIKMVNFHLQININNRILNIITITTSRKNKSIMIMKHPKIAMIISHNNKQNLIFYLILKSLYPNRISRLTNRTQTI